MMTHPDERCCRIAGYANAAAGAATSLTGTLSVSDAQGVLESTTVTIAVADTNRLPNPGPQSHHEGQAVALSMQATDLTGTNSLTYSVSDLPDGLSINPSTGLIAGFVAFTNASNSQTVSFSPTVTLTDNNGGTDTRVLSWSVTDAFLWANPDSYSVPHDQILAVSQGVLANDYSAVTGSLIASLVTGPSQGTLTLNPNGSFLYKPNAGYTGTDGFTYSITDSVSNTATTTVAISVFDNNAPVGVADSYTVVHNQSLSVNATDGVLANDSDADYIDSLTATLVSGVSHGTLTLYNDGSFLYTPSLGYIGVDGFTYQVSDGALSSSNTTVTLQVANTPPVAQDDSYGVHANQPLTVPFGVLLNDSDPDGDSLTASLVSGPSNGSLTLYGNGSFTYTPSASYTGPDSFTYLASDGTNSTTATVTLNVHSTNTAPSASADSYSMMHDQTLSIGFAAGVLANDSDADGDPLTATLATGPSNGALTFWWHGGFIYTPNPGYDGLDSFTYTLSDGLATVSTGTVSITVVNRLPSISMQSNVEGQMVSVDVSGTDTTGTNSLTYTASGLPPGLGIDPESGIIGGYIGFDAASNSMTATYTPTVTLSDDYGGVDTRAFTWLVADAVLTANPDSYSIAHDRTLSVTAGFDVLANDLAVTTDSLTASLVSGPSNGSLTFNIDGTFLYVPASAYYGTDSFTYSASDGISTPVTATVTLTVTEEAPSVRPELYTVAHGRSLSVGVATGVLSNDSDSDGDSLTATLVSGPSHGTVTLNADGSFLYTVDLDFTGVDYFTYEVSDGLLTSDEAMAIIQVTDSPPVAVNDLYGIHSDATLAVGSDNGVLANDSDPDGDALTASLVSGPSHGTLSLSPDGGFSYTPTLSYSGLDEFVYQVSDGALGATATVTLNVHSSNNAPWGEDDSFTVFHDQTLSVAAPGLLGNDNDPDGDLLTASLVSGPSNGSLTFNSDGSFVYVPGSAYSGEDSFTYSVSDALASSDTITVSLTVQNQAPQAVDDSFVVEHNTPLSVTASGILANDGDAEGDTLTASLVSGPSNGSLTLYSDGSFLYTPATNYSGPDSFTYTASDGVQGSPTATVSLTVKPANTAPDAVDDTYSVTHDQDLDVSVSDGLLANDSDVDGDTLTASLVSGPSYGSVTLQADGSFLYTPTAGYSGADSFTYSVSDGTLSATATVSISVIDEAPQAADDRISVLGTGPTTVDFWNGVLANDYDPDSLLEAVLVNGPAYGSLTLNADGGFVYTPGGGFTGEDSFTYKADDGTQQSGTATVTLVAEPVAVNDYYEVQHDQDYELDADFGVLGNDMVASGASMTVSLVDGPQHGSLTLNADGSFLYTPDEGYVGPDQFTYEVEADSLTSNVATVYVEVVNQAPEAADDVYQVAAGSTVVGDLSGVASDPDVEDTLLFTLEDGPEHGTLVYFNDDGTFEYQPAAVFVGTDSFTYYVDDGAVTSGIGTVTILVGGEAPIALDVEYLVEKDGSLAADPSRNLVTTAAYDMDADELTPVIVTGPFYAESFWLYPDGTFDYTPLPGFEGEDWFQFQVSDGVFTSNLARVVLQVADTSNTPGAFDDVYRVPLFQSLIVDEPGVLWNDDPVIGAGVTISVILVGAAPPGLNLNEDGGFTYTPPEDMASYVEFKYKIRRTVGQQTTESNTATVTLFNPSATPTITLIDEQWSDYYSIRKDDGSGYHDSKLGMVAGGTVSLVARFRMTYSQYLWSMLTAQGGAHNLGANGGLLSGGNIPAISWPTGGGSVVFTGSGTAPLFETEITLTWTNLQVPPFPGAYTLNQNWILEFDTLPQGRMSVPVTNTKTYTVYILNEATTLLSSERFHTVVRVGAMAANHATEELWCDLATAYFANPPANTTLEQYIMTEALQRNTNYGYKDRLMSAVMDEFKTLEISRADDPKTLTYYSNWQTAGPVKTTKALLSVGDGQCMAWTRFFLDVLSAQGFDYSGTAESMVQIYHARHFQLVPPNQSWVMLYVKNWVGNNNDTNVYTYTPGPSAPHGVVGMIDFTNSQYRWKTNPAPKVTHKANAMLPGQGNNNNPQAIFADHFMARVTVDGKEVWFDPSYGMRYDGTDKVRRMAFQNGALSFLGFGSITAYSKQTNTYTVTVDFEELPSGKDRLESTPRGYTYLL